MTSFQITDSKVNSRINGFIAVPEDQDKIHQLIIQTAEWLRSQGSKQWSRLLSGQDDHNLEAAVLRGEVVVFREEGEEQLAGVVILQLNPSEWDRGLWNLETSANFDCAIYVHRLAVNRRYSGTGLGGEIMAWIEQGIAFSGVERIRLDCVAYNEKLSRFYERCGYEDRGEMKGYNLYEKLLRPNIF